MMQCSAHDGRRQSPAGLQGLPADIRACKPTVFCSVPKIFERFESAARDKVRRCLGGGRAGAKRGGKVTALP